MQFLFIADVPSSNEKKRPEHFKEIIAEEVRATVKAYMEGVLRQVWLQHPGDGAVALMEADSLADAEAILAKWPLERAGLLEPRLIALKPFPGFGRD